MLKGIITLCEQECEAGYDFAKTKKVMTKGFANQFGHEAEEIVHRSIEKIMKKYPNNADAFQVLYYNDNNTCTKYYLIVDDYGNGTYVLTALLPEEY